MVLYNHQARVYGRQRIGLIDLHGQFMGSSEDSGRDFTSIGNYRCWLESYLGGDCDGNTEQLRHAAQDIALLTEMDNGAMRRSIGLSSLGSHIGSALRVVDWAIDEASSEERSIGRMEG